MHVWWHGGNNNYTSNNNSSLSITIRKSVGITCYLPMLANKRYNNGWQYGDEQFPPVPGF